MAKTLAQGRKPGSGRKPGTAKTLAQGRKPGSGRKKGSVSKTLAQGRKSGSGRKQKTPKDAVYNNLFPRNIAQQEQQAQSQSQSQGQGQGQRPQPLGEKTERADDVQIPQPVELHQQDQQVHPQLQPQRSISETPPTHMSLTEIHRIISGINTPMFMEKK